jgi:hypothetical protein
VVPRAHADPAARLAYLVESLTTSGILDGTIRVPGAVGDIAVSADLRARQISTSTDVSAPTDRGSRARVMWLLRQLGPDTPRDVMIEAWPRMARHPLGASLAAAQESRDLLLDPDRREILRFCLIRRSEMGQNRKDGGRSPGFIESTTNAINTFYGSVIQQIVPWTARPPQARAATRPTERADEPIEDAEDLHEAIGAARATAGGATGTADTRPKSAARDTRADFVEAPMTDAGPNASASD